MTLNTTLLGVLMFIFASAPVMAQAPVTGAADPESLFTSPDPKLNANKQVVLHIMRDLLEANQWDDAPKYLSQRYLQHNPLVASGLDPVMKFFKGNPDLIGCNPRRQLEAGNDSNQLLHSTNHRQPTTFCEWD